MSKRVQEIPKDPGRFALFVMKPFVGLATLSFVLVLVAQLLEVALPYILKKIVDAALLSEQTGSSEAVLFWLAAVPVSMAVMYTAWRSSGFVGMIWLNQAEEYADNILFSYVTKHSHGYFSNRFAGSIANKIGHAALGTEKLLEGMLWQYFPNLLNFFVSGALVFYTNFNIGVLFVIMLAILLPLNIWLAKVRRPYVVAASEAQSRLKGRAVDVMSNISATRQYVRRDFELKGFAKHVRDVVTTDLRQWRLSEWILVVNNVVIVGAIALMMWVMAHEWQSGALSTGDFVLVVTLIFNMSGALTFIGSTINGFVRTYGEVQEGLAQTLVPHEITDAPNAKKLKAASPEIVWDTVDFAYEEQTVFRDFDLTIKPGERIGLVGHSGAGKTTFVSLLLRQHDIQSGEILIDGQNIAQVTQESLRAHISVVPQEPLLFHRSIKENILYGKPRATKAEMIAVAKKAQAHDFIMELPKGYDTLVGERGVKLSGGQKQRVAIARAMLKDAPILVLDEATSALDSESEVLIQKALESLMEGRTVIAVAHRLSTLRKMDRIIVMDHGRVLEDGTHDELSVGGGVYQSLWEHQAGGFLQDE